MDNFTNPENNTQNTVDTYSQPGALTGESANWQSSSQMDQGAGYTETYSSDFVDPSVGYTAEPEKKKMIGFAIASLILGILSVLCCCCTGVSALFGIVGVILGVVTLVKKFAGKGCAIAGIICSSVAILSAIVSLILALSGSASLTEMMGVSDILEEYGVSSSYDDYYF